MQYITLADFLKTVISWILYISLCLMGALHIKGSKKATTARPPDSVESTTRSMSASSGSSPDSGGDTISMVSQALEPRSVLVRPISVQELEDPRAPYVKRSMRIECDVMGFGFVLRGSSPCYVQTVDPLGPAAAAGLRVRHFISTVNGEDVLRMDHRQVGQIIGRGNQLTLTVLVYRRDADTP